MWTVSLIQLFVHAELQDWTPGFSPCSPTLHLGEVPVSSPALTTGYHPAPSPSSVGQYPDLRIHIYWQWRRNIPCKPRRYFVAPLASRPTILFAAFTRFLALILTVRASNTGGFEIFRIHLYRLRGPPRRLYNGYRLYLAGVKGPNRGVDYPSPF